MEENRCCGTEETQERQQKERHRSRLRFRCMVAAAVAVAAVIGYVCYWQKEEEKTFHRTKDSAYAMIETEFYELKVPAAWLKYVSVEIAPVNEIYGGWESDGQSRICEENYQVQLLFETDSGTYPVADIAMYAYLSDCQEQLDNWRYWGQLTVSTLKEGESNRSGVEDRDVRWSNIVINYAEEPEELTAEEHRKWRSVKNTLSEDMLLCRRDDSGLYTSFSENSTGKAHGWASTWEEVRRSGEEVDAALAELKRKQHEEEMEEQRRSKASSSSSDSAKAGSSSKTCIYPGCRNQGVSNRKGYCHKHYEQLYGKRDDFYDEDPESYYQDNKSMYRSRSEAYDDWEDEYEED